MITLDEIYKFKYHVALENGQLSNNPMRLAITAGNNSSNLNALLVENLIILSGDE